MTLKESKRVKRIIMEVEQQKKRTRCFIAGASIAVVDAINSGMVSISRMYNRHCSVRLRSATAHLLNPHLIYRFLFN